MLFMAGFLVPVRTVVIILLPASMQWAYLLRENLQWASFQPVSFLLASFPSEFLMSDSMHLAFLYWHGKENILNCFQKNSNRIGIKTKSRIEFIRINSAL